MTEDFSVFLGVFDDDVSIRPNWKAESSEEGKVKQIRLAYSWSKGHERPI